MYKELQISRNALAMYLCHLPTKRECYASQGGLDTIQVMWETFTSCYGKFNQDNIYQTLSKSASFCKRHDKNIHGPTAAHLQNANAKFHKVA